MSDTRNGKSEVTPARPPLRDPMEAGTRYVSTSVAADRLGMGVATLGRWCRDGLVPGAKKLRGNRWRIPESSVLELLEDPKTDLLQDVDDTIVIATDIINSAIRRADRNGG